LVFVTACEETADISNPVSYEKVGISFKYPKNWEVTEDAVFTFLL